MKLIRLIIVAAIGIALLGSCRSKLCPGYGNMSSMNDSDPKIEQTA